MEIKQTGSGLSIKDPSLNINCTFSDGKLSGTGVRKHKSEIEKAVANYNIEYLKSVGRKSRRAINYASYSSTVRPYGYDYKKTEVTEDQLKLWASEPVRYNKELRNASMYFYSLYGIVTTAYSIYTNYHSLDSSLKYSNPDYSGLQDDLSVIGMVDKALYKKPLLRQILFETVAKGTCIGYVAGNKKKVIQFLDLDYYLPYSMINGVWQVRVDLYKFSTAYKDYKNIPLDQTLSAKDLTPKAELASQPLEVRNAYARLQNGKGDRHYYLNLDRTFVIKNMSSFEERLGRPMGIGAFSSILRKELIKDAERSIIDRVINLIMVLKMGDKDDENEMLDQEDMELLYNGVKTVMETDTNGLKLIGLPEWGSLSFPDTSQLELFDKSKYAQVDSDISVALGVQGLLGGDSGANFSSGQLSLRILIANIFAILEQIEENLFNRQYEVALSDSPNMYTRQFNRALIMDDKEIVNILSKLSDKGFSIKAVLDSIGIDFKDYVEQTKYETETLGLQSWVEPYRSSSTLSGNEGGRPSEGKGDNGNSQPSPSD